MSLVVGIIAPIGRDAELIALVLQQNGIQSEVISAARFSGGCDVASMGPLLLAEEALTPAFVEQLRAVLQAQPAWSDLPILILTGTGRETLHNYRRAKEHLALGSPILLERPIRALTLVSSVQAALSARARQYEIRDAVAALHAEQATLKVLLDSLPVGVLVGNIDGKAILSNTRLEAIFRHPVLPTPDIKSYAKWPVLRPDGSRLKGEEYPLARAILSGQTIGAEEYLYERGDGTRGWISLTASPLRDEAGAVSGGVVVVADIDLQKRSEVALLQNEKLAAVGRLAASISHEINNPLEAVVNLLYLARQAPELTPESAHYLSLADQELARVAQIVSHTLRFHRQSSNPRAISAEELLEPTLGIYLGRLNNAGIALLREHGASLPITCYEGEIRQVLNNLVGNAIDAMKSGGRLRVRTRQAHDWKTGALGVRFTIADTGHGMTEDVRLHVFDAFYTTKGINGTGLGLWIAKGIAEKHKGFLDVRTSDAPGRSGTVFTLFLPYAEVAPP